MADFSKVRSVSDLGKIKEDSEILLEQLPLRKKDFEAGKDIMKTGGTIGAGATGVGAGIIAASGFTGPMAPILIGLGSGILVGLPPLVAYISYHATLKDIDNAEIRLRKLVKHLEEAIRDRPSTDAVSHEEVSKYKAIVDTAEELNSKVVLHLFGPTSLVALGSSLVILLLAPTQPEMAWLGEDGSKAELGLVAGAITLVVYTFVKISFGYVVTKKRGGDVVVRKL